MDTGSATRKEELIERVVGYAMANGISDLSLRPLAEAIGTSPRMLIYHFGSKEALVVELLNAVRARQDQMIERWRREGVTDLVEIEKRLWEWMSSREMRLLLKLYFESFGLALQGRPGFEGFLDAVMTGPLDLNRQALSLGGAPDEMIDAEATLRLATIRGLMLDLAATGDEERVNAAFELSVELLIERLAAYQADGR